MLVRPRLGQGTFSMAVRDAYGGACAVTREHSLPVLEAAHIRPYADGGEHEVSNGLLLRSDLHRLFDRGYVTVTPDLRFRVSSRLRTEYKNGRTYYALDGSTIAVPADAFRQPDREALRWHEHERFRA
jgi:putative restriction endonuclease